MRVLMVAVVCAVLLSAPFLVAHVVARAERRDRERRLPPGSPEERRMLEHAMRQLDRALVDPMYRQSTEWEDQAKALVDAYYGKGLKR